MKRRNLTPLGVAVKKALIEKGMTQVELADRVGANPNYIDLILHGQRSGKKYITRIANILDLEDILQSA